MKPKALYYTLMQYQPVNFQQLQQDFDLIQLADPSQDRADILSEIEILFAPLGFYVDAQKMDRCPKLKAIVSNTTGIPHIDADAAAKRDIAVCALHDEQAFLDTITPTAEHTIGLLLAVARRVVPAHHSVLKGHWDRNDWVAPSMLSRLSLGIVGYGRLGKRVARVGQAFDMQVDYYDPYVPGGAPCLKTLAEKSNVLSLHAPANAQTQHCVSREILMALPKGAIVINTARGELLDTQAMLDLLESGHLAGAGLDTLPGEYQLDFQQTPLFQTVIAYAKQNKNVVLTPHIGGSTSDARIETERFVIDKARRLFEKVCA